MVSLIGTGILGVPVLAGCAAYAVAKAAVWHRTLQDRPLLSRKFSNHIAAAMLVAVVLNFVSFNAVEMLFYSTVLNGMLTPPLID
jgi:Mn2+/Fe2+ NRAMP family transporter